MDTLRFNTVYNMRFKLWKSVYSTYGYVYTCIRMHADVHMHAYTHMYLCTYVCQATCVYLHMYIHLYDYVYRHALIYAYTYVDATNRYAHCEVHAVIGRTSLCFSAAAYQCVLAGGYEAAMLLAVKQQVFNVSEAISCELLFSV